MVLNKIRFAIACVLGLFPFTVFLTIHVKMSSIYKLIKKYKFIDWLDTRIIHIGSLSMELFMRMIDLNGKKNNKLLRKIKPFFSVHVRRWSF